MFLFLVFILLGTFLGAWFAFLSDWIILNHYIHCGVEEKKLVSVSPVHYWIVALHIFVWGSICLMRPELSWWGIFPALSFTVLISLSVIDFEFMAVPDSLNILALVFALLQPDFVDSLINAVAVFSGFYLFIRGFSFLLGKEAMGGADFIIVSTMAALLGIGGFFAALFLGAFFSLVAMMIRRSKMEPFIPYLTLSTFLCFVFSSDVNAFIHELFVAPFSM